MYKTKTNSELGNSVPYLMIVIGALIIASNHVLARYLDGSIPPLGLVFWRMIVAAIFLAPVTMLGLLKNRHLILQHWKLFFFMGALFVPLGNGLIYVAYLHTTAINGGVVSASQPAITVLLTWLLFRERINWRQCIGIFAAGIGVLWIITKGEPSALLLMNFNFGDLTMFTAVVFGALYNVLIRNVPKQIRVNELLVLVLFSGSLITLPLYVLETIYYAPVKVSLGTIFPILWVGIAVTAIAVGMISFSIRKVGANKASISNYMRALFTALLAVFILGETFENFHVYAIILILGGVFLMTRGTVVKSEFLIKRQKDF